jgi:hypothetical protein
LQKSPDAGNCFVSLGPDISLQTFRLSHDRFLA